MADKLYYVSSVNVQLKHSEQLMKCIHNNYQWRCQTRMDHSRNLLN